MLLPALLLATPGVAYAVFAFVSEQNDPLHRPKAPLLRKRWHYGRRMGTGWLLGALVAMAVWRLAGFTPLGAGVVLVVVFAACALPATISLHRHDRLWEFAEPDEQEPDASPEPRVPAAPTAISASAVRADPRGASPDAGTRCRPGSALHGPVDIDVVA